MTDKTSFVWDTMRVVDGLHAIRLVTYDKAGNLADTSVDVRTINMKLAIEEAKSARNIYVIIGVLSGLVMGMAIAWIVLKKKLAPSSPSARPLSCRNGSLDFLDLILFFVARTDLIDTNGIFDADEAT